MVLARQMPQLARCALEVHTFWPVNFQPPSVRTALVRNAARSDPAPGSLNSWHQYTSPVRVPGMNRSICSGVPACRMVGAAHQPIEISGRTTPALLSSSSITSCSPGDAARPNGAGQCGAMMPAVANAACCWSIGSVAISATAAAISGRTASPSPVSTCSCRRTPSRVSDATRRSHLPRPPRIWAIAYARRRYRWASCSQVKPIPPST